MFRLETLFQMFESVFVGIETVFNRRKQFLGGGMQKDVAKFEPGDQLHTVIKLRGLKFADEVRESRIQGESAAVDSSDAYAEEHQ